MEIEKTIDRIETLLILMIKKVREIKKMVTNPDVLREQLRLLRDSYFEELCEILNNL